MNIERILAVVSAASEAWLMADGRAGAGVGEVFALPRWPHAGPGRRGFRLLPAARTRHLRRVPRPGRWTFRHLLGITLIHNAMINVVPFRGGEAAFRCCCARILAFRCHGPSPAVLVSPAGHLRRHGTGGHRMAGAAPRLLPRCSASSPSPVAALLGASPHAWADGSGFIAKFRQRATLLPKAPATPVTPGPSPTGQWETRRPGRPAGGAIPATASVGAAGALGAELAAILPIQGVAGWKPTKAPPQLCCPAESPSQAASRLPLPFTFS